jgi:hypothetical protein
MGSEEAELRDGRLAYRLWLTPYTSRPLPDTPSFRTLWGQTAGNGTRRGGLLGPARSNGGTALAGGSPHVRAAIVQSRFDYHNLYDPSLKLDVPRHCDDDDMSGTSCHHLEAATAAGPAVNELHPSAAMIPKARANGRDEL